MMSILLKGINTSLPYVDPRISNKVAVSTTAELPLPLQEAFSQVLWAVATQLEKENKEIVGLPINCIFSDDDFFAILKTADQKAICMKIAFYPLKDLLPVLEKDAMYLFLAEELCHLIWDISDETEVNIKVLAVLRNINLDLQMSDLYAEDTVRSCLRWLQDHPAFQL